MTDMFVNLVGVAVIGLIVWWFWLSGPRLEAVTGLGRPMDITVEDGVYTPARIEVFLGGDDGPLGRRAAVQDMPTTGIINLDDANGDGMDDFVLYDPQSRDATVRVGLNLGTLPVDAD